MYFRSTSKFRKSEFRSWKLGLHFQLPNPGNVEVSTLTAKSAQFPLFFPGAFRVARSPPFAAVEDAESAREAFDRELEPKNVDVFAQFRGVWRAANWLENYRRGLISDIVRARSPRRRRRLWHDVGWVGPRRGSLLILLRAGPAFTADSLPEFARSRQKWRGTGSCCRWC